MGAAQSTSSRSSLGGSVRGRSRAGNGYESLASAIHPLVSALQKFRTIEDTQDVPLCTFLNSSSSHFPLLMFSIFFFVLTLEFFSFSSSSFCREKNECVREEAFLDMSFHIEAFCVL